MYTEEEKESIKKVGDIQLKVLVKDGLTGDDYNVNLDDIMEDMFEDFIVPIEEAIKDKPKEYVKGFLEGFFKGLKEKDYEECRGYMMDKISMYEHFFSNRTKETEHTGYMAVKI